MAIALTAAASDVSDLMPAYGGAGHSPFDPTLEDGTFVFETGNIKPNGKFDFILDGVPIPGKVTNKGVVTVKGKIVGMIDSRTRT